MNSAGPMEPPPSPLQCWICSSKNQPTLPARFLSPRIEIPMENILTRPDGCQLFYTIDDFTDPWREPATVLFIHGLAESTEAWRAWMPHFAGRYRCVRVDVRGFGRSSP